MKNSIKNIYRWIPFLFFGIALTLFTNCEEDIKFEDMVPDYTYSIMRSFSANGQTATIDHTNGVVNLILPAGTDNSSVTVEMTLPGGATVDPASGSTLDFSSGPVIFTVSNNGISREYTVTIAAYGDPMIMTFAIGENVGVIDQVNGTIDITVGSQEDIKALSPQYTIPGGTTASPQSGVINDFTDPVKYTVLSNDGFTGKSYIVTVTQLAAPVIDVFATSEDVCAVTGIIDNNASTINIILPAGSDLSSVSPVITLNDELTVSPASGEAQNFSQGAVTYTVTNQEGLTKEYLVTISSKESTQKVVFLGEADCINTLEDDDAKAAAEYLKAQYPDDFAYIKIANITEEALANSNVAMLYYLTPLTSGTQYFATSENVMTLLPAELQPGALQAIALTNWVKGGGNLFLAGDPTSFIHVLGRMPADYSAPRALGNYRYTEFGCADAGGCVDYDKPVDDIWGLGVRDANNSGDRRGHPIFNGLTFEGDGELYLNNAGTREARLIWWQHMDGILTPGCCGQDAALVFEQTVNAVKLGTLRWIGDGFGYGAVEFLPTNGTVEANFDSNISTDFAGKVITLENTILGYEFDSNGGRENDYQGNIEMLTSNIIDYLNN
ncbi:DUF5018 domain-containing protein [Draconibacterium orientale]|uniref:DUF5018 domain-containing protein n=1 Tax=Draconibacterium orientale TaxID=1168034 RepID=UPI0029C010F3|nr:DUF5018 domain-containing protein [Draconibacterium orientale]